MNKIILIILSFLGGMDVVITIFTPIILVALWISMVGLNSWTSYLFFGVGLLATLFRAIKIGFKENLR